MQLVFSSFFGFSRFFPRSAAVSLPAVQTSADAAAIVAAPAAEIAQRAAVSQSMNVPLLIWAAGAALLAAYFLLTGRWRQPPVPAAGLQEPWLTALRRVFLAESVLQRDCAALAEQLENGCLRQLLAAEAERAATRGKSLAALLENSLTTANNLLKW